VLAARGRHTSPCRRARGSEGRDLLVSNTEVCGREERRSSQSLRSLAKQCREREGVWEAHEQPPGGVGNNCGDFQ
jgi:hypothetical protein